MEIFRFLTSVHWSVCVRKASYFFAVLAKNSSSTISAFSISCWFAFEEEMFQDQHDVVINFKWEVERVILETSRSFKVIKKDLTASKRGCRGTNLTVSIFQNIIIYQKSNNSLIDELHYKNFYLQDTYLDVVLITENNVKRSWAECNRNYLEFSNFKEISNVVLGRLEDLSENISTLSSRIQKFLATHEESSCQTNDRVSIFFLNFYMKADFCCSKTVRKYFFPDIKTFNDGITRWPRNP